ncbi:hypothetical protein BJ878DRAFT_304383 [Calycina marina]|uniref:Arrestin-like N-terminal domain-containing protein n=1 Tax=Calycina marina TaxID=1763456 RepID=A0A9P7YV45_9HELO|nr:hypothetical protein BJ878DRAFT_304383 [Calycina marina]
MSVHILLDNPHNFYTNLDFIVGRIILSLTADENVSAVVVKLEGESRTLLAQTSNPQGLGPYARRDSRQTIAMENHKILYKVNQVFPSLETGEAGMAYTLRAGKHEYPFRFKLPFNNGCADPQNQQIAAGSGFAGLGKALGDMQQMSYMHVKKTLPPSLTGFPGEAEVRYYIKVTVQRPSIFKENRRRTIGFKFLPIEPPRPAPTSNEAFARRQYSFGNMVGTAKKKGMFGKMPTSLSDTPPKGDLDARLPSPPILTCNEPVPLRLILRKTAESPEQVYFMGLQVNLLGSTEVRAQGVNRMETSTWVLTSLTGLSLPVGKPTDALRSETLLDSNLWNQTPLPNTVAPSFSTCNLTRSYELELRVTLGYGTPGNIQPQLITLPLRFHVEVYSGIKPPAALITAMASRPVAPAAAVAPVQLPPRPSAVTATNPADPLYPPQLGSTQVGAFDEAPPSYEDAMADEITPADEPRREYSGVTDVDAPGLDEKGAAPSYGASQNGPGPSGPGR